MTSRSDSQVYIISGFAAIGGFLYGYDVGVISGVLTMPDFLSTFGDATSIAEGTLTSSIRGAIVGVFLFGAFLGALIAGQAADRFSRKYSIVLFSIIFIVGAALQSGSVHLAMLLIARLISDHRCRYRTLIGTGSWTGVAVGALSMLVPLYLSEIARKEIRGRLASLEQWAETIGLVLSFWIDYGTGGRLPESSGSWRIPLALQIVPALILAIGILFFPFSPRWLISKGRELDALAALIRIRSTSSSGVQDELNEIKNEFVLEREKQIQSYMQLVRAPLRRRLILGMGIQILQQLTGINAVMYYAPEIFNQAGLADEHADLIATGINGCVNVLATIPAIIFIDILGRRVLLISGAIIMSLSMFTIGGVMGTYGFKEVNATTGAISFVIPNHAASYAIIVFVYIFVAGFAFSWGPITPIYCTEIFPLTMRAKGTSITTAANWAANCVVSFVAPVLLDRITFGTYIIFGIFCVIMGILTFLFYPETKGKSLEEMDQVFNRFVPLRLLSRRTTSVDKMAIDPSFVVIFKKNGFTTLTVENPLLTSLNRPTELTDNMDVPEVIIKRIPEMSSDVAYHWS